MINSNGACVEIRSEDERSGSQQNSMSTCLSSYYVISDMTTELDERIDGRHWPVLVGRGWSTDSGTCRSRHRLGARPRRHYRWSLRHCRRLVVSRLLIDSSRTDCLRLQSIWFHHHHHHHHHFILLSWTFMKLVHWPLIGGLLHLVQQGGDWAWHAQM